MHISGSADITHPAPISSGGSQTKFLGIFILAVKTTKQIAFCKNSAKGFVLTDNPVH